MRGVSGETADFGSRLLRFAVFLLIFSDDNETTLPEDLELGSQNPSALQTLSVAGGSVTMNYHPLGVAVVQLVDQYVTGTIGVKVISEGRL